MTTEHDLLRELDAALDVSPSPDFEARVRERVGMTSIGVPRWTWPVGVAVAAAVVLAVMLAPGRPSPVRPETSRPEAAARVERAPAVTSVAEVSRPSIEARGSTTGRRPRREVPAESSLAAVVVPAGQMAAIQRLMSDVSAGRVVMGPERPAPPAALQVSALAEVTPIEFDTIRFTPLSADASPDLWR